MDGTLTIHSQKLAITTRRRLKLIKEVKDDFSKWNLIDNIDTIIINIIHGHKVSTFALSQFHHRSDKLLRYHDLRLDIRLFNSRNLGWVWKL